MISTLLFALANAAEPPPRGQLAFGAYEDCLRAALDSRGSERLSVDEISSIVAGACSAERAELVAAAAAARPSGKSPDEAALEADARLLMIEASLAAQRAANGPVRIVPADQVDPR